MISEQEVNYLKGLVKSHGKRKALLFYDKDYNNVEGEIKVNTCAISTMEAEEVTPKKRLQLNVEISPKDKEIVDKTCDETGMSRANYIHNLINNAPSESIKTGEEEENIPVRKKFNKEEFVVTVDYIQDIKERLEDLEAEKNQLLNELESLRKEVMSYI